MNKKKKANEYITITGLNYYYGREIFRPGMTLTIKKDRENPYDQEAIKVMLEQLVVGYVANSVYTVAVGTKSAGRIYDMFGNRAQAEVMFITNQSVIAKVKCH